MIAISYVAKNNKREFVTLTPHPPPPPPPPPPAPSLLSERNKKYILFFFLEVIKHCNIIRSFHCLIVMLTLPCATLLRPQGYFFRLDVHQRVGISRAEV